jgi:ADP-ribose pyrophosphatase YjhB (NUDIX family)
MTTNSTMTLCESFQYCPRCAAQGTSLKENPFRCSSCQFVYYFSPVSAVGALIVNRADQVLFVVRDKEPARGTLGLPGGFVDSGETLEAAMCREVAEETSLHVTSYRYLCSFPNRYQFRGIEVAVTDAFFVGKIESAEGLQAQAGEVRSCQWLNPTSNILDRIGFESNRLAVETYLAENR